MFRNKFQKGYLSILYSCGASPLELWGLHVQNGYIRRVTDKEINSLALEIAGTNVSTTYIYTPKDSKAELGVELCYLIMIIKNMRKYFTFEITNYELKKILDDKKMHRRFRLSNFQSSTSVRPFSTAMPIGLSGGWNQVQFNLADFCKRAYGSNYIETTRMQIHANCRIRRIYFSDRLYQENELPEEYRVHEFIPKCVRKDDKKVQQKQDSKTNLSHMSNQSQKSLISHREAEFLSTIVSKSSINANTEEHTKIQIEIPTAEYDVESDILSTEREFDAHNELIEEINRSEQSIENNEEENYTSQIFE